MWVRRKEHRGDEYAANTGVASHLAAFLIQATDGAALRQAIEAGTRAGEQREAELTDALRGTDTSEPQ